MFTFRCNPFNCFKNKNNLEIEKQLENNSRYSLLLMLESKHPNNIWQKSAIKFPRQRDQTLNTIIAYKNKIGYSSEIS